MPAVPASLAALACSHPGCQRIAAEPGPLCQHHLMAWRRGMGLCANCGGRRERIPVVNALTGRQQRRYGAPVWQWKCLACGREQRPKTA